MFMIIDLGGIRTNNSATLNVDPTLRGAGVCQPDVMIMAK